MVANVKKYSVLENINYDTLKLVQRQAPRDARKSSTLSLFKHCCKVIHSQNAHFIAESVRTIPTHLMTTFLQEAIQHVEPTAVATILANWPLPVLCFKDVIKDPVIQKDIFNEEMVLDLIVFKGITSRTRYCKLKVLDLRGFPMNWPFTKLVVQSWPLLSLKKSQRSVKKLTNTVLKMAEVKKDNRLALEIIPKIIGELLSHEVFTHPEFIIRVQKGSKMVVKVDKLEFSTRNTFFMDYLITNCLRSITSVHIEATSLHIKSELQMGDDIMDSLAPFIVLRGQDPETLKGVCLENLEDNVCFLTASDLQPFSNIRALGLMNCNIHLQEGRTRGRTLSRNQLTTTLGCFQFLCRLDLSQNSFAGCLPEVLDSLQMPLEFLSLRGCDLLDRDYEHLANSRHAKSIKDLNLSKICGLFPNDGFAVSCSSLVRHLKNFDNLADICISQNQLTDTRVVEIRRAIREHWPELKGLDFVENIISADKVLSIIKDCTKLEKIQYLRVPYSHNLIEAIELMESGLRDFKYKVADMLKTSNREDIVVDIGSYAFAFF